ncbi:MAG: ABC transporter ATP-binding protein [Calditrichaeota bacterium]|nr:MAG: ABC transporter ATP-binding protein [Calditrichota bacterium]
MLSLEAVYKSYHSGVPREILHNISFQVNPGESVAIVGPSGSGKSTLLNLMGGLDRPTMGRILLDGRDLASLPDEELARVRNREIGFIFQLHHLLPQLSVLENVLLPTLAFQADENAIARAESLLNKVGLGAHLHQRPAQLSGGEQQRTAVVRALINQPKLLLADEPTGSLDAENAENLGNLLVELNRSEKVTLVLVTHALHLAEKMDRVLELRNGLLNRRKPA